MKTLIFEDEIILFWKPEERFKDAAYKLFLNGKLLKTSDKTHFEIKNLTPETEYEIKIVSAAKDESAAETLCDEMFKTKQKRSRIDVSKAPYNAVGDGKTLNTAALQRAIDDCGKNDTLYFPKGEYLSGALRLHSNMELYIEEGAVIKGTAEPKDYLPKIKSRFEGLERECYSALINMGELESGGGYNCENVAIRGGGSISGGGRALCDAVIELETELQKDYINSLGDKIKTFENEKTIPGRARPRLINISNCRNISICDIDISYGPAWVVHMVYSKNVITCGSKISSQGVWNGDGWDPDSSEDCVVFNTVFNTGDDGVAIKSGKNPEGNVINRPSRNIWIFDCRGIEGASFAIGSEMSGGVEDVYMWDCDFSEGTFCIKATPERGGYIRNVYVYNSIIAKVEFLTKLCYNNDGDSSGQVPVFENFGFEKVSVKGLDYSPYRESVEMCPAITLNGFKKSGHETKNVVFKDVILEKRKNGEPQEICLSGVKGITFENIVSL